MSIDVRLASEQLATMLADIGITAEHVQIRRVDPASDAFFVTIVSPEFEGQTFLDREMRVRPAVSRLFATLGAPRSDFVIEPLSPEDSLTITVAPDEEFADTPRPGMSRPEWRQHVAAVRVALEKSHFLVSEIADSVVIAERSLLSPERIAIGFATSPNASTVDLEVRSAIAQLRESQTIHSCYYISPNVLTAPFANQQKARWLALHTATSFLHLLNSSQDLAKKLILEIDSEFGRLNAEHRGPVIEPDIRRSDNVVLSTEFFRHAENWIDRPGASLMVVMAAAGHGKTTIGLELARRLARQFVESPETSPVPLVVPFEAVRRAIDFESLLHKRLGELRPGGLGPFLTLLKRREAVLVIDGFDELADDAGFEVAEAQVRSMRFLLQGQAKVLLAGRSLFTEGFAGRQSVEDRMRSLVGDVHVDVVELLPFDTANIERYVDTREGLKQSQRDTLKVFCKASPDHEQLASSPLFLRMLCSLASGDLLPKPQQIALSVSALLQRVYEREEERQHLGIGVHGQQMFLRWLAVEAFATGRAVARPDLRLWAEMVITEHQQEPAEVAGRLMDHALIQSAKGERVEFIHPIVRDVILGEAVDAELGENKTTILEKRDLPEGTVRHLASDSSRVLAALPDGWLTVTSREFSTLVRRNLFRIVSRRAQFSPVGNPRIWAEDRWMRQSSIRELDLSGLVMESLSFDSISFHDCSLSDSLFDDCDFRGSGFVRCTIRDTSFETCRADSNSFARDCVVTGVIVSSEKQASNVDTGEGLVPALLKSDWGASFAAEPNANVAERCDELIRELLEQFVVLDPAPRFHMVTKEAIKPVWLSDRERAAVERVLLPAVLSKFCSSTLTAGSRERYIVDKRYHAAVVSFLRTGERPAALAATLTALVARAAKFFS